MTAEEYLGHVSLAGELGMAVKVVTHDTALKAMHDYARLQIEKDREKIKKKCPGLVRAIIATIPITLD